MLPNEDSYINYRKHLVSALRRDRSDSNAMSPLISARANHLKLSTNWHVNVDGVSGLRNIGNSLQQRGETKKDLTLECVDYPKTINFIPPLNYIDSGIPPFCSALGHFILDRNRKDFKSSNARMANEIYKTYKHGEKFKNPDEDKGY